MEIYQNEEEPAILLKRFNQREASAFGAIYMRFFTELHVYAMRFYSRTSESAEDAVQEAFYTLWERRELVFDSVTKIKAFLFVAIKNRYKNQLIHWGVEQKYKDIVEWESGFSEDIVESELAASLSEYVERMPEQEGKVMKLYLAGHEAEEIAAEMQWSVQTVYNVKSRAMRFLKRLFCPKVWK